MSEEETVTITVPKGDPAYSTYIWRADSITLARMRPALEEFEQLITKAHCEREDLGAEYACFDTPDLPLGEWCFICRFRRVRLMLHLAANPRGATT